MAQARSRARTSRRSFCFRPRGPSSRAAPRCTTPPLPPPPPQAPPGLCRRVRGLKAAASHRRAEVMWPARQCRWPVARTSRSGCASSGCGPPATRSTGSWGMAPTTSTTPATVRAPPSPHALPAIGSTIAGVQMCATSLRSRAKADSLLAHRFQTPPKHPVAVVRGAAGPAEGGRGAQPA